MLRPAWALELQSTKVADSYRQPLVLLTTIVSNTYIQQGKTPPMQQSAPAAQQAPAAQAPTLEPNKVTPAASFTNKVDFMMNPKKINKEKNRKLTRTVPLGGAKFH